jgi:hypothetical protein
MPKHARVNRAYLTGIKTKSIQTKLHSLYYTEQHVLTILGHLQVHNFFVSSKRIEEGIKVHKMRLKC